MRSQLVPGSQLAGTNKKGENKKSRRCLSPLLARLIFSQSQNSLHQVTFDPSLSPLSFWVQVSAGSHLGFITCAHLLNLLNHYLTIIFVFFFFLHQHPEGIWYDPSQKETIASSSSVGAQVLLLHIIIIIS